MARLAIGSILSLAGAAVVTVTLCRLIPVNATTAGFAYLLFVLLIASVWGFFEASLVSIAATLVFNFFFFEPIGTFTIDDPQNWVALFSFLVTALIASRLSTKAETRARDAIERRQDIERLYTFSRAILLIDNSEPLPKQIVRKIVEIFEVSAAVLFERRTGDIYRAGPSDFDGLDDQLRDSALQGVSFSDPTQSRIITAVRLGSEPTASLALQGAPMPDSVLQGIANLAAIGLERARAQDMAHQIEAARQSEQLRTTLIDAMAHEFKTPLTSIKAVTTSLLASPDQLPKGRREMLAIADEEAEHLRELIDNAVEMARLDTMHLDIRLENANLDQIVHEVAVSMRTEIDRPLEIISADRLAAVPLDRRLMKLALEQLVDNALKYSPPGTPVTVRLQNTEGGVTIEVTDHGKGIPAQEQAQIFERFYRSPSIRNQIPGSGLGLTIAHSIVRAHEGDLKVTSHPGETTFRMVLPLEHKGEKVERGSYPHRRRQTANPAHHARNVSHGRI